MKNAALLLILSVAAVAQNYKAEQTQDHGVSVVRLTDAASGVEVSLGPTMANSSDMKVHGKSILTNGIPFLAPWANRLGEMEFWANGKEYPFNPNLGNVRSPVPSHGLLMSSELWRITEVAADANSAHVTRKLEFWRYPDLMAQWPFAHEYEITHRLAGGVLEVKVTVTNVGADPMPISLGFHPCYRIPDVSRDEWGLHLPARTMVVTDDRLVATGEFKANSLPNPLPLKTHNLDTGFTDLERDADGKAHVWIESAGKKVEAIFGPKYAVALIFDPPAPAGQTRDMACIEPMAAITNALNLNHAGKYPNLQSVAPGATWTESFWIRAGGI
jgi:aldose 1-epimerase